MPTYNVGAAETYTTITLALAAIPSNLSGGGVQEVIIEAGTYTETVSILSLTSGGSFINPSSSDYIYLRAKTGDEHGGLFTQGVIISGQILIGLSFTRFKQLVIIPTSNIQCFLCSSSYTATDCLVNDCLGKSFNGISSFAVGNNGDRFTYIKCIAWSPNGPFSTYSGFSMNAPSRSNVYKNCVSYGFYHGYTHGQSTPAYQSSFENCVAYSTNQGFVTPVGTGSNNASSDTTAIGPNSITNLTLIRASFVDQPNGDFHVNNDSALLTTGIEQSAYFTTDIDGQNIPLANWPIGVDYTPLPTCWTYTARYKNSKRLFRKDGPGVYPSKLRVPSNVDKSSGQMVDEGQLIDPSKYSIN